MPQSARQCLRATPIFIGVNAFEDAPVGNAKLGLMDSCKAGAAAVLIARRTAHGDEPYPPLAQVGCQRVQFAAPGLGEHAPCRR